jgi:hypothetical protein
MLISAHPLEVTSISAQEPEAEQATQSAAPSETTQNLKERIERVVKDKQDQIKGVIDNLSTPQRGFIGQVQRVSQEALTVRNPKGVHIIPINSQVEIDKAGDTISIDEVAVDEWALIMGQVEDNTFVPKRIEISTQTLRPRTYAVVLGSVSDISASSITVLPRSKDETVSYSLRTSTDYQDLEGSPLTRTNITEGMQILLVGYQDDDENVATTIQALITADDNDE